MKITDIKAIYPKYKQPLAGWRPHLWQIVVRVESDSGVVGYGYGGGGEAALPIINGHWRDLLIGQELNAIGDIAAVWDVLYQASLPYGRKGVAIMALSGVDLALWDLLGRAEGMPVSTLLGGRDREQIRAYATGTDSQWYAELGFTAHKLPVRWQDERDYDATAQLVAQARAALGPDAQLMLDCYMSWDADVTRRMAAHLASYNLYWFEDVVTPDQLAAQAALRADIGPVLLAGGEHEFTHYGFREIAQANALDIWQPDITWCGGITAGLRIVDLAQQVGAQVIPHRGGEVWGLHLIAATECVDLAEVLPGTRAAQPDPLWLNEPPVVDGVIIVPDTPGFGVVLNEDYV
ncbi:MAG: L-rhamnonate dehydratase [Caldilineaceae bacterium]|nr:L-rhamnonate dehydratase [Caldilineaceae bacterium]